MLLLVTLFSLSIALTSAQQGCSGATILNGAAETPSLSYYAVLSEFIGVQRVLNTTQQVVSITMPLYYTQSTPNPVPIHVSFGLYGPSTCGTQGDSVLLGITQTYMFPASFFTAPIETLLTLQMAVPLFVSPGTYYVMMDDDSSSLGILLGTVSTGAGNIWVDAYSFNTYNASAPINFPNVTVMNVYYLAYESTITINGAQCTSGNTFVVQTPACVPRPFLSFPSGYSSASVRCNGSAPIVTDTYSAATYNYQSSLATDVVRLIPTLVSTTQTIYAVSFLAHPQTSPTANFTMRPAVYVQGANATTYTLIAQANQTFIPGSYIAGNFVYLYFPLQTPVTVQAGTTIYINRLVDQSGLYMVFDQYGQTLTGGAQVNSSLPAPQTLTTSGTGGVDVSRGFLGCPVGQSAPAQACTGTALVAGPAVSPTLNYYAVLSEFIGVQRVLNTTQQVVSITMPLYYTQSTPNPVPIHVSFGLYGPSTCGTQGDSVLLGITQTYMFPASFFTAPIETLLTLQMAVPLFVSPGTYYVMMDDDSSSLGILLGTVSTGAGNIWVDAYSFNTYNASAPINFPNVTVMNVYYLAYESTITINGAQCTSGNTFVVQTPACVPRPFLSFPSGYSSASVRCNGSAPIVTDTYSAATYNYQSSLATDVVRLIPTLVSTTQTIYAVSFLAHPQTSPTANFTMRPAVYVQGANATTYTLIAQANQTFIPGSYIAGNFVYLYFPLQTPVTVQAGTTIYINRLVDQSGLYMVFDQYGQTLTGGAQVNSSLPAPQTLTTSGTGGVDVSRGFLGCPVGQSAPAQACTGTALVAGPAVSPTLNYYAVLSEFIGVQRVLNTTQQVVSITMPLYYTQSTPNPVPIHVSFGLYGPSTCGTQGDSVLLGITQTYMFPASFFTAPIETLLTLQMAVPLFVSPGTYYVMMDDDSSSLGILLGTVSTGAGNIWVDAYSFNTYNASAPINFPNVTVMNVYYLAYESTITINGAQCTSGNTFVVQTPACVPRPFLSFPSGYSSASVRCNGSAPIVTDTYSAATYNYQSSLATDVVRLIPTLVSTTQTIYAVSFLAHPQTSPTANFTMRPAVYVQGANATTYTLIAQANQTFIPGSYIAGNFVYLYFPLQTPVTVQAGTTIYINRLVDQSGLYMVFDQYGQTLTGGAQVNSSLPAPQTLTTSGTGGVDVSVGLLACPSTFVAPPSSSTLPPSVTAASSSSSSTAARFSSSVSSSYSSSSSSSRLVSVTSSSLSAFSSSSPSSSPSAIPSSSSAASTAAPAVTASSSSSSSSSSADTSSSSGGGGGGGSSSNSSLSSGAIAGIVVGSVIGAVVLVALCWLCLFFSSSRKSAGTPQRFEDKDSSRIGADGQSTVGDNDTLEEGGEVEMQ